MHTYLVLKEKAAQWNADKEIQAILSEVNAEDGSMTLISASIRLPRRCTQGAAL